jgi:hypothetical protein
MFLLKLPCLYHLMTACWHYLQQHVDLNSLIGYSTHLLSSRLCVSVVCGRGTQMLVLKKDSPTTFYYRECCECQNAEVRTDDVVNINSYFHDYSASPAVTTLPSTRTLPTPCYPCFAWSALGRCCKPQWCHPHPTFYPSFLQHITSLSLEPLASTTNSPLTAPTPPPTWC